MDCTEKPTKTRVVLGILTQGSTHHVLTSRIPDLAQHPLYEIVFVTLNERPIEHVRNKLAKIALDYQAHWLLMIDADNPPVKNPYDLIALDKDILACPTPMYKRIAGKGGIFWNTGTDTDEGRVRIDGIHKRRVLMQRDIVGTGCILMRRNVLEAVRPPFVCDWDADGLRIASSDWTFCRRARALGFEVWAHYGYPCRHFSEVELSEITELDYASLLDAGS